MAIIQRSTPDDFNRPTPHGAPLKSTVNAVLARLAAGGNTLLSLLSGLLAAVMILYSGYVLYDTVYIQNSAARTPFDLLQYRPDIIDGAQPQVGGDTLAAVNKDYRAWLTMYGSNIDYPVMQSTNDLYYASHDVYGHASVTGAIYLAAENSGDFTDSYSLIYGHHMENGAMFGGLDDYLEQSYFNANREGVLVSPKGVFDLKTFAVVTTDAYEPQIYKVGNRAEELLSYLRACYTASDGKTTVEIFDEAALVGADKVLALSTCADAKTSGRLLVFCTMTRRNMLTIDVEDPCEHVYDGKPHEPEIDLNYPDGTTISYSTDGGRTWHDGVPSITNVGEMTVLIRAENEYFGTATAETTLRVTPKELVIKVRDKFKVQGQPDPAWEIEYIRGLVDDFKPAYTLSRTNAGVERVGTYYGVLVARGATMQGNYHITYLPGDFKITSTYSLDILANGYVGVYDGEPHGLDRVEVNITDGAVIEYSTDGGRTWSTTEPTITNVGSIEVMVRATSPRYGTASTTVELRVEPATVTVKANSAQKTAGEDDPEFDAVVTGLLNGDTVSYVVTRPGAGEDEEAGRYFGAIVPSGEELQGNYKVVYEPADFTIIAAPTPVTPDEPTPGIIEKFEPRPSRGTPAWALFNLICLILTAYILVPLLHLKGKYSRAKSLKDYNELVNGQTPPDAEEPETPDGQTKEKPLYDTDKFERRFWLGIGLEVLTVIAAIVAFILTEDMRLPMIWIDKWSPLMLVLLLLCLTFDILFIRNRQKLDEEEKQPQPEEPESLPVE